MTDAMKTLIDTAQDAVEMLRENGNRYTANQLESAIAAAQAEPKSEPDMRHPKIQALIGAKARREIELRIAEDLLDDPKHEISWPDGDYWYSLHDKIVELQHRAQAEQSASVPTNAQDAENGNENAIRHIAYAEGYKDGESSATSVQEPVRGERWYILRKGATTCSTVIIELVTPAVIGLKTDAFWGDIEIVPRNYLTLVERVASAPQGEKP